MAKVNIIFPRTEKRALADRVIRLNRKSPPIQDEPLVKTVQFLRGVNSLASRILPAFYLFLAAKIRDEDCILDGYPGILLKHSIKSSSVDTIAISCRKIFDHGRNGLTGANFAKDSDETLKSVAEYWSEKSSRSFQEALTALMLLRAIFRDCAMQDNDLFNSVFLLCPRIALLKQYANRSAAHLSLENYEFSLNDCVHVVAAITVIGEIIRSFDKPYLQPNYFDELNEASLIAAKHLFPGTPDIRLFQDFHIESRSRLYWEWGIERGHRSILDQLPYAISWF